MEEENNEIYEVLEEPQEKITENVETIGEDILEEDIPDEIDLMYNDKPVCPYCGEEDEIDFESEKYYKDDMPFTVVCSSCLKDFLIRPSVTITYSTEKYDDDYFFEKGVKSYWKYYKHLDGHTNDVERHESAMRILATAEYKKETLDAVEDSVKSVKLEANTNE